jgi:hypothetical protein
MPMSDRYCPTQKKNIMTWPTALSTVVINRMCEFIKNWASIDKGIRLKELHVVAEVVLKLT